MNFAKLQSWIAEMANLTKPKAVKWCNGSVDENREVIAKLVANREFIPLNAEHYDNCYLYRSHPNDVARTEQQTFVCSRTRINAGPNNNWLDPQEAHNKMSALFQGCMQGRMMYVIPYCMGPINSPHAGLGIEITDSLYVVANMYLMTRMGDEALTRIKEAPDDTVVRGLHSVADLDPSRRYIVHFPEELMIMSIGSGYGGNALLGKKCHALRIASWQARQQGWLAEHMLIAGIEHRGEVHYIAAAFPSSCGKTNLAMLIPPPRYRDEYKVWTVGDDIAWMRIGDDGRLWAINPEAGYFGVVPGTNETTNPTALSMINRNTIFTNVALTEDKQPWWEGKKQGEPHINWKGKLADKHSLAAHPNSRFTVCAKQCPSYSPHAEDPQGVPISAIIFGGRRSGLNPLVVEAFDWSHGVFMGASLSSETTAAAIGEVGVVRRDPMAMLPFCGYNMADYWQHWLNFQQRSTNLPTIFQVNWFRKDKGEFLWPGFGDNLRVLRWIIDRCQGRATARKTAIGHLPDHGDLDCAGLNLSDEAKHQLFDVDTDAWRQELRDIDKYFATYGERLPQSFTDQCQRIATALG